MHGRAAKGASQRQAVHKPSALCNVAFAPVTLEAKKSLFFFFTPTLLPKQRQQCGGLDLPRQLHLLYVRKVFYLIDFGIMQGLHAPRTPGSRLAREVPVVKTWLRRSLLAFAGLASSSLPCLIGTTEKVKPFGRFGGFPFMP